MIHRLSDMLKCLLASKELQAGYLEQISHQTTSDRALRIKDSGEKISSASRVTKYFFDHLETIDSILLVSQVSDI